MAISSKRGGGEKRGQLTRYAHISERHQITYIDDDVIIRIAISIRQSVEHEPMRSNEKEWAM